jgi:hypothetical protein
MLPDRGLRTIAVLPGTLAGCARAGRGPRILHGSFSVEDLAGYRGPKPQHRGVTHAVLREAAAWIRRRSSQLRDECGVAGVPYVDGELGFEAAMLQARRLLLGRG